MQQRDMATKIGHGEGRDDEYHQRLNALIAERGMNRSELATKLGVSYQAIKQVLDGRSRFSGANLLKVAEILGVNPAWLVTGTTPRDVDPQDASRAGHSSLALQLAALFDRLKGRDIIIQNKAYVEAAEVILKYLEGETKAGSNP